MKTHYMIFSNRHCNSDLPVLINGTPLEKVTSTKFLGVIVDHKLLWKEHVAYVKNKLSKCIVILLLTNFSTL